MVTQATGSNIRVNLTGSPLETIQSSSVHLSPSFTTADTDYVWYCANGINQITMTFRSAGTISDGTKSGHTIQLAISIANNEAVNVQSPSGVHYWVRCLPASFPHLSATVHPGAPDGYYLTGNFASSAKGYPGYPMILNSYGTPVWYLTGVPGVAQDVELLPGTNDVAWVDSRTAAYIIYDLNTGTVSRYSAAVAPTNEHELYVDPSGNYWMISTPNKGGYNLSSIGYPDASTILDCVVQEMNSKGQVEWKWTASEHVSPDETDSLAGVHYYNGTEVIDVYHCNSIDVDPLNSDHILVSMRHVGVFEIDKASGKILWKLGGTSYPPMDKEPVLSITGDPESTIQGQHDARFQPNGSVTIFDDHTDLSGAARAVQYAINVADDTAAMSWQYAAPTGDNTRTMGSTRLYDSNDLPYDEAGSNYLGPKVAVVDWGHGVPKAGFTVIDYATNAILMNLTFPSGIDGYRAQLVPLSALHMDDLHRTAGTTLPVSS